MPKIVLKNITSIPYAGVPGNLVVFGQNASVVLSTKSPIEIASSGTDAVIFAPGGAYNPVLCHRETEISI